MLGFTEKVFSGSQVSINYVEGPANGPPLILLHGLTRDWHAFTVLLPQLSRTFHVSAMDLRGHGRSSRVAGGYRISQFAHDVAEFISAKFPAGAAIFGHSLGAMTAMLTAADGNCRISALVLGDSMITPENFRASLYAPLFRQLHALLLRHGGSQAALAAAMGKIVIPVPGLDESVCIEDLPGNTPEVLSEWARCALLADPEAIAMTLEGTAFADWFPHEALPRIGCPALLLQANPELDGMLSDEDARLALRLVPNARHVKFPLLGHALFMHQAKPVLDAVMSFLASVSV